MKGTGKVSSGKIKCDSVTGKSVIDQFGPYMKKILGTDNRNYINMLLTKKVFSYRLTN